MKRNELARSAVYGLIVACVFTPPLVGFYWGWMNYAGMPHPPWPPWLGALAQAFMSWLIYGYMLSEQGLFATRQSSSFVVAFLLVSAVASWGFYVGMQRKNEQ